MPPGDSAAVAASLVQQFTAEFHRDPEGVWFAPGRANLNGEHIDFHGGRCLPFALAHGTYVAAAPRTDGRLRLRTLDPELDTGAVWATPEDDGGLGSEVPSWTRYVAGVLWALRQLGSAETGSTAHSKEPASTESTSPTGHIAADLSVGEEFGADLLICSSLPIGAGLSSSASLECAVALALVSLGSELGRANPGLALDAGLSDAHRALLAQTCIRAEVEVVGAGTGGLDQTTSLRAVADHVVSLDCRDFTVDHLPVGALLQDYVLVAVDSGQPHALVTSDFSARRAESEAAATALGVTRLRDALGTSPDDAEVSQVLERFDEVAAAGSQALAGRDVSACRRRLQHALTEMVRSEQMQAVLAGLAPAGSATPGAVEAAAGELGRILSAGHESMRDAAEVSFPLADSIVSTAHDSGALGARLIGGGFGGSVLVLAARADLQTIADATAGLSDGIRLLEVMPSVPARVLPTPRLR